MSGWSYAVRSLSSRGTKRFTSFLSLYLDRNAAITQICPIHFSHLLASHPHTRSSCSAAALRRQVPPESAEDEGGKLQRFASTQARLRCRVKGGHRQQLLASTNHYASSAIAQSAVEFLGSRKNKTKQKKHAAGRNQTETQTRRVQQKYLASNVVNPAHVRVSHRASARFSMRPGCSSG